MSVVAQGLWRVRWAAAALAVLLGGPVRALAAAPATDAVAWPQAVAQARADLAAAQAELTRVQAAVREERQAVQARRQAELDAVRALREEARQAAEQAAAGTLLAQHEAVALEAVRGAVVQAQRLLDEYRRDLETRLAADEAEARAPALAEVDGALAQPGCAGVAAAAAALLQQGTDSLGLRLGGYGRDGFLIAEDGSRVQARFCHLGPFTFAHQADGRRNGLAVLQPGSPHFRLLAPAAAGDEGAIGALAAGGEALVPVDVSGGRATRFLAARESLPEHIRKGGIIMVPLLLLAVLCSAICLYKTLTLPRVRLAVWHQATGRILALLQAGAESEARRAAAALGAPLGPILETGIMHRSLPKEQLEEVLYERMLAQVPGFERFLAPLAVFASAAPLLGLLGTVTGMIHTFHLISLFGTGNAQFLSSGIAEALITTEYGLYVAIPALLMHAYLSRRVRRLAAAAQEVAVEFLNGLRPVAGQSPATP